MRVHRIVEKTFAEGPGCRFSIWVQGCNHHCDGCFATDLWDFKGGYEISTEKVISDLQNVLKDISGVTFLGGEPFEYAAELSKIAEYIHSVDKNVITFTGYDYETLKNQSSAKSLLDETDLLIDGRFEKSLVDYIRPLVGSKNQQFIFLTDKISKKDIIDYKDRFEIVISQTGKTEFNGMGNIDKLKKFLKIMGN